MPKRDIAAAEPAAERPSPEKTVLWVDPNLTFESPTTKHLLYALPHLREAGWTVRIWCIHSDVPKDQAEHVIFSLPAGFRLVEWMLFFLRVNLYGLVLRLRGRPRPATIIHATCGTYLGADAATVQFLYGLWARRWFALGFNSWREVAGCVLNLWGALCDRLQWLSPALRLLLPVSDSIAEELRCRTRDGLLIRVLPNSYDETRFNLEMRSRWRETQRAALGIGAEERVFVFVSMGHHRRKGFWLAVEALHQLGHAAGGARAGGPIRLLVVGGTARTLAALSEELDARHPGWKSWVTLVGMQAEVEKFYAAADAFLFPSYFEAFCLAEIEAAASGLPLLLTPHHGSEMILEDGRNGVRLSFDPGEMSRQIERFLQEGLTGFQPGKAGRALNREAYAGELIRIYDSLLERDHRSPGESRSLRAAVPH